MEVYTSKKERILLAEDAFSSGGEGEVRMVVSGPSRYNNVCVKIYYQKRRTKEQENKIKYMVSNPPGIINGNGFIIGWPIDYVVDYRGHFMGFIMPVAFKDSKQLIMLTATKLSKKLDSNWWYRYDRSNGKSALVARMKLICNIAIPVHILHSTQKYVFKDFKPENILVTYDGRVTIVDMDSVQISEGPKVVFPGEVATPNYMPTEYYKNNVGKNKMDQLNKSWDNFAIGVVFYQILFGLHPFVVTPVKQSKECNEIYYSSALALFPFGDNNSQVKSYPLLHEKFKVLPTELQNLFKRAFSENMTNRPNAEEWGKCIHKLVEDAGPIPAPKPAPKPTPKPAPKPTPKPTPKPAPKPAPKPTPQTTREAGVFALICSFLIPIVGVICYFTQKNKVNNPSAYLYWAFAGFILNLIFTFAG